MALRQGLTRVGENPYLLERCPACFLTCRTSFLFKHWRPVDVGPPFLSHFLYLLSIFSLPFLILPIPNSFWSRCRTRFLIHLDTWKSLGHVFHMPLISPLISCMMTLGFPCAKCSLVWCHMARVLVPRVLVSFVYFASKHVKFQLSRNST